MAEIVVPGVVLLWIGLAALGTGLVPVLFGLGSATKVVVFLVLLAVRIGTTLTLSRRQKPPVRVNTPDAGWSVAWAPHGQGHRAHARWRASISATPIARHGCPARSRSATPCSSTASMAPHWS
jgi:hypothetical protein